MENTKQKTMRVRILVRVGVSAHDGEGLTYSASGWGLERRGHGDSQTVREDVDAYAEGDWTDGGRYTWIVADVPVPSPDAEVCGYVEQPLD